LTQKKLGGGLKVAGGGKERKQFRKSIQGKKWRAVGFKEEKRSVSKKVLLDSRDSLKDG